MGVHEKRPDESMSVGLIEGLFDVSPTVNVGLVKPLAVAVNVILVFGATVFPGARVPILTDGGGRTVIVCEIVATSSFPRMVKVKTCVPISFFSGTHEKRPPRLILLEEAVEPLKESCSE